MNVKEELQKIGLEQAVHYVYRDPIKNLNKILSWADSFDDSHYAGARKALHEVLENPAHPYRQYISHILENVDEKVAKRILVNFFINADLVGWRKQDAIRKKYGCNVPWTILLDPTSACNLHCTGCWAAEYGHKLNLSLEEIDDIIRQGKEMGVYMYIYTGGEPLVRKHDLITLCERHPDCVFLTFTNGTLIDDAFADEMLRVGNLVPAISLEGFEQATDGRRGNGVYQKVQRAMEILHRKKLFFGISSCYTRANFESITSEAYFDMLIEKGAFFIWYFHYMPVGNDASAELLPTSEQRVEIYRRIRKYRTEKPLFAIDFQNDGEYVGGCIAGGRRYLHINANGDIDPCVFIHYSDSNIRNKTILEALRSPLFMAYHDGQPFNKNMLRPCPMLENPEKLRAMVKASGAVSTDLQSKESVDHLCGKCDAYAKDWAPKAEQLWEMSQTEKHDEKAKQDSVRGDAD
ncbi:MAG: radical SAM protein [Acidaminococcus sp.]|jgi:MoaA/NifB/PqqE/SkfB family radical SAM enzyme|nr:radical SAM protein [Acidaminococcus sp.]MCI2114444.1 radical SAM protein [Acidaminococcus sp.]